MLFSSPIFLFLFLPLVLSLYFFIPNRVNNIFLLCASIFFYWWGEKQFILIMLVSIGINYYLANLIGSAHDTNNKFKVRVVFGLAITFNIGLLIFFKYGAFILHNLHLLSRRPIEGEFFFSQMHLPLGISFFTFHSLSYIFDVFRKKVDPQKKIVSSALYIAFFPQLIAGTIIRYHDIYKQLAHRRVTLEKITYGIERFILGLGKKVLIANVVGNLADTIFSIPFSQLSLQVSWLGIICYILQIYFDFSGYSDMAIGLARIFGFDFMENFNYPYISKSITEFWHRWHISLSNWFRDYLYIPLGGNRIGKYRTYLNLIVVFLLCGLWHGASWTFVIWGLWHGIFLVLERSFSKYHLPIWNSYKHLYSLLVIMIGWVFFRSPTLKFGLNYLQSMFSFSQPENSQFTLTGLLNTHNLIIIIFAIFFSAPVFQIIKSRVSNKSLFSRQMSKISAYVYVLFLFVIFLGSAMSLAVNTYNPFIYFRF